MQPIDPLFKKHHKCAEERFLQIERKERRNVILTTVLVIALVAAVLAIGFYWGN